MDFYAFIVIIIITIIKVVAAASSYWVKDSFKNLLEDLPREAFITALSNSFIIAIKSIDGIKFIEEDSEFAFNCWILVIANFMVNSFIAITKEREVNWIGS